MHTVNILNHIVGTHQYLAYIVIFFGLIFEGEVVVITTGVLCRVGALSFWVSLIFMLCGGAVKTFGGYYLGELIHKYWNNNNFLKHVEKRVHYLMPHFKEKPFWSIWLSQFIMGVNYLVIIFCGYNKVNYKTYLKADLSSTLVWAPLLLSLGYFFGQTALSFSKEISRFSLIILILIIIFLLFDKLVAYFYSFLLYFKKENMHLEENKDEKK